MKGWCLPWECRRHRLCHQEKWVRRQIHLIICCQVTNRGLHCRLPSSSPWSCSPGFPSFLLGEDHTTGKMQTTREKCGRLVLMGTQTLPNDQVIKDSFYKNKYSECSYKNIWLYVHPSWFLYCSLPETAKTYRSVRELIFRLHEENTFVHGTDSTQGLWWAMELQTCVGGRKTLLGNKTQADLQPQK